jgi:hypothetical protein
MVTILTHFTSESPISHELSFCLKLGLHVKIAE